MKFEDRISVLKVADPVYDEDGYPVEGTDRWREFGKCFISFNSSAAKIRLKDGSDYQYAYYIIAPLKKDLYPLIPKEGERVRFVKADNTINQEMEVRGFVTYKKRYLKIWV